MISGFDFPLVVNPCHITSCCIKDRQATKHFLCNCSTCRVTLDPVRGFRCLGDQWSQWRIRMAGDHEKLGFEWTLDRDFEMIFWDYSILDFGWGFHVIFWDYYGLIDFGWGVHVIFWDNDY